MTLFRLLPLPLLIAACATMLSAQRLPEKNSAAVQSTDPVPLTSSVTNPFSPQSSQFNLPHTWLHNNSDWQSQADTGCLKMRTYKVARDGPNTDSTHPVAYSTCTPATRFQTHSIVLRLSSTP
jgi:hypothetical protein